MISLIVPTMWKYVPFYKFLEDILNHPKIGEVIIIDNDVVNRPKDLIRHPNLKIKNFGENVFVNPAWNYGVVNAKYDKLCITNDDIIYDLRIYDRVYDYITEENGPTGLSVKPWHENFVDGLIRVQPYILGENVFCFANVFFIHRKSYNPVPNGLDLFFGDNYLFDTAIWYSKPIHVVKDLFYFTPYAATCSQLGGIVAEKFEIEREIYRSVIEKHGHDPKAWCPEHYGEKNAD